MLRGQQAHCQAKKLSNAKNCQCVLDFSREGLFPSDFFPSFFQKKTGVALICLVEGGGGFRIRFGTPVSTQEILPLLRALTYKAERTLDLPRHGAARACPWLSTALVAGSVRSGRKGDWYSQRRS